MVSEAIYYGISHCLLRGTSGFPHCRQILYSLSHKGSPTIVERVAYPFLGDIANPGIEPGSLALQEDSLPAELLWKPIDRQINV